MLRHLSIGIVLFVFLSVALPSVQGQNEEDVLLSIRRSHISANVPDERDFESFMIRDLTAFMSKELGKPAKISYELLRNGPTQSGIAFPKFYVWLIAKTDKDTIYEGSARVAAIEKKRFEVTDFLTKEEIVAVPEKLDAIFPTPVSEAIRSRLKSLIGNQNGVGRRRHPPSITLNSRTACHPAYNLLR